MLRDAKRTVSMANNVVVITGGNTGIGKATAAELCKMGAFVVIACRDVKKGEEAAAEIDSERMSAVRNYVMGITLDYENAGSGRVRSLPLDLADLHTVGTFVEHLKRIGVRRVDVLINNAGINSKGTTDHGLQALFQVNYLGHFLLVREMLPLLQASTSASPTTPAGDLCMKIPRQGRIVNLSSVMHHRAQGAFRLSAASKMSALFKGREDVSPGDFSYYADSKYYMNLLTLHVNRLFGAHSDVSSPAAPGADPLRSVTAISVNPGAVRSDIWRHTSPSVMWMYDLFMRAVYLTTEQGAGPSVFAAYTDLSPILPPPTMPVGASYDDLADNSCDVDWAPHPLVPYVVPYYIPSLFTMSAMRCAVLFELVGLYAGPQWCQAVSLTANANRSAAELWAFSGDLCDAVLRLPRGEKVTVDISDTATAAVVSGTSVATSDSDATGLSDSGDVVGKKRV